MLQQLPVPSASACGKGAREMRTPAVAALPMRPMRALAGPAAARSIKPRRADARARASASGNIGAWESQVKDGRVRSINAEDVKAMVAEGWTVLDVRPPGEHNKASVAGAVHVPLFVEDTSGSIASFIKRATDFGMGGWWLGGTHNLPNQNFANEVREKLPLDARCIVVCQKGLRSLAACETVARLGYKEVAWINGGLDMARKGEIDSTQGIDIRYGGIGGLSEVLGWTEVQRDDKQSEGALGGLIGVIKFFAFILAVDVAVFAYEQASFMLKGGSGMQM